MNLPGSLGARTAAGYDRIAGLYASQNVEPPADVARLRDRLAGRVAGGRVLDLGCGPGRDLAWFAGHGFGAIGLDRSAAMLELAAPAARVRADLGALPFPDGSFGGLWSAASLLHVPGDELGLVLGEWRRVLEHGGVLGIVTSTGGREGFEVEPLAGGPKEPLGRWFADHDEGVLRASLGAAGFRIDEVTGRRWLALLCTASSVGG